MIRIKNLLNTNIKSDFFYYLLFFITWASFLSSLFFLGILNSPIVINLRDEIIFTLFSLLICGAFPFIISKTNVMYVFLYICVCIAYKSCYIFFPYNEINLKREEFSFLFCSLPTFFLGLAFIYNSKINNILNIIAKISIIGIFFYTFFYKQVNINRSNGELMVAAYNLLPHVLFLFSNVIKKKKLSDIIFFIFGLVLLFGFGTRGPLVAFCLFILCLLFRSLEKGHLKHVLFFLIFIISFYFILYHCSLYVMNFMSYFNLSPRVFESFLYADKVSSSGRDVLSNIIWNGTDIIQMHGFAGDRFLLNGAYTHNFFFEMWYDFGIFGGSLIMLTISILIILAYRYSQEANSLFIIILACSVFGQLMFSGSFLTHNLFYFLLGYSVSIISKERRNFKHCILKST